MKKTLKIAMFMLLILLTCTLILTFAACDESSEPDDDDSETDANNDENEETNAPQTGAHIHAFGEWEVTTNPTCTANGIKERHCSCGEKQTGEVFATHQYNEGTITQAPTCTNEGSKTVTCTVCNKNEVRTIPALGHSKDSTGKCTLCGLVSLNMTAKQTEEAKTIKTMTHTVNEYSTQVSISITLKDDNEYYIYVPAYVDVTIKGEDGTILYSETIIKKDSQYGVEIDYDNVTPGLSSTGTLYYKVYNDYVTFDEISHELTQLPWTVDIELPELPTIITDKGYNSSACRVTNITYKISDNDATFYFSGEKTYDEKGNNYSQQCKIGWKLYDSDGYVVDSGTCYSSAIKVEEKFKDATAHTWDIIEQGKTYRLVILDVD